MDYTSYEEINRGKRNFIIMLLTVLIVIGGISSLFTNYKYETLICSKSENICYVEKTNWVNVKKRIEIAKISDLKYSMYIPKTVAGNMYASGYTTYFLNFRTKFNTNIKVFSTEYYDKGEVKSVVSDLNSQLKDDKVKIVKIIRKL